MQALIVNGLLYNIMWLGSVHYQYYFIPIVLAWSLVHLITKANNTERALVLFVFTIGVLIDSILMHLNVFQFKNTSQELPTLLIPLWMWSIWLSFSLTIFHSLSPLSKSFALQVVVGALVAPMSYFLGRSMGAVSFGLSDNQTLLILALVWGIFLPSVFKAKKYMIKQEVT